MSAPAPAPPSSAVCPYVGLRYFDESDAEFFYGRDEHVIELLGKLASNRFVAVLGSSASGKSSLVRAGLLPELRSGMIPSAGPNWRVVEFKPGRDPMGELSNALEAGLGVQDARATVEEGPLGIVRAVSAAQLERGTNVLIIADQFEEVFRFQREEGVQGRATAAAEQCQALSRRLLEAAGQPDVVIYVLLVMRSDYLGDCAQFPDLPERISKSLYLVPRLRRDQLQEVVTAPVGGRLEPALVQTLINEAGSEQDQLPRLQHLLARMWQIAGGRPITLEHYKDAGGWRNGLEDDLNRVFGALTEDEQKSCPLMFQQLSELDKGRAIRRRVALKELCQVCGGETEAVVEKFRSAGFLTLHSAVVDVTHECVLRCWSKAQQWLDQENSARNFYLQLVSRQKLGGKLDRSDLREVSRLQQAGALTPPWALRYGSPAEFNLIESYVQHSRRLLSLQTAGFLLVIGAFLALGLYTILHSKAQERNSKARELTAYAALSQNEDPATALYLGLSAARIVPQSPPPGLEKLLPTALLNGASFGRLLGHSSVNSVAWSPDGKTLASASVDQTIRLWDAASGQALRTLSGHTRTVTSVAWSPDGKTLASASGDQTIRLWDAASGQALRTLSGHTRTLTSVAWSPDGKTLASASVDQTIRLWDAASGQALRTLSGHTNYVTSVAWSPDGKTLASASWDQTIRLWDAASGQALRTLSGHTNAVNSVAWSPDGKTLASASWDQTIRLWDAASGQALRTLSGHTNAVNSVAWSPDGKTLASASVDQTIRLWDAASGQALRTLSGHTRTVTSVAWSPDGKTLASASGDQTIRLWDAASGQALRTLSGHTDSVNSVAWSPDGKTLASASVDQTIRLWDAASGQALRTLSGHTDSVNSVAWSPDGKTLASASGDQTIRLWDAASGQALRTLSGHAASVTSVAWSPDGKALASASGDQTIRLWDAAGGQALRTLSGHTNDVNSVAWSPDGKTLASASGDQTIRLWDAAGGQALRTLSGHTNDVDSVAWSPDGKTLASASGDQTIRLWDAASGQALRTLSGHTNYVNSVAWSPDGKTLASASWDQTIRLWDAASGQALRTLSGHTNYVNSVAWSPDGKTLASASWDSTIRLWPGTFEGLLEQAHYGIRLFGLPQPDCQRYLQKDSCPPLQ